MSSDKKIVQLDRSGGVVRSVSLAGAPSNLADDNNGGVWATVPSENSIAHVTLSPSAEEIRLPTPNALPTQIFDDGDIVLIAESGSGKLARLTESTGKLDELPFTGSSSPVFITKMGFKIWVVDNLGSAYVVDWNGERPVLLGRMPPQRGLRWASSGGGATTGIAFNASDVVQVTSTPTSFQVDSLVAGRRDLVGVAFLGGIVWFADAGTNSIGWNLGGEKVDYLVPTERSGLAGMTITDGRYLWSAEQHSGKVVRIDATAPRVERISGSDRYELAVNISKAGDYSGSSEHIVFVVSGETFADALSAGPIAAAHNAPVLLTTRAALPPSTRGELVRLAPRRVVVVGGPASVSSAALDSIKAAVPGATVDRVEGADRYAVSRALLTGDLAPDDSPTLYVANGGDFPDALSSTAAAAHLDSAILLVNGAAASLSADEMKVIGEFKGAGKSVKISGGPNSVSTGIETQIRGVATVQRLSGADRYLVSQAIVRDAFTPTTPRLVYLASGTTFPDALAGGVGAGLKDSPVLLVHPDCVPQPVVDLISDGITRKVTLYGGPVTLNGEVEKLTPCR
ncbi:cell wall-binding repeat-containing protein [Herbiconiux ginsengi]|uniref:cell wall-binding repeat-containing protein n=1 Tax=Herbiconiux ginsengi TaxID=381665 RepID=UPI001C314ECD|nr:cell wall-binding repeat-containing protein [Herbiconiux ginsengi]